MITDENVRRYLKDSLINSKLCRWQNFEIPVFILSPDGNYFEKELYCSVVNRAIALWNAAGKNLFELKITAVPTVGIKVRPSKVGRVFEGMCKYESIVNSEFRSTAIEIGMPNKCSPKTVNEETIFHSAVHEFGHALGLGHGTDIDDVMFVPHKKTLAALSKNDTEILKIIYSFPAGTDFIQIINSYIPNRHY